MGAGGSAPYLRLTTGTWGDSVLWSTDPFLRNAVLGAKPIPGGDFSKISRLHPRLFLVNRKRRRVSVCTCAFISPPPPPPKFVFWMKSHQAA